MNEQQAASRVVNAFETGTPQPYRFMEVCGTHTVSIFRSGIKTVLPEALKLISGPGCPVCVTPTEEIDRAIRFCDEQDVILTTFGDLLRVPGTYSSLAEAKARTGRVRVVVSPLDALDMASRDTYHKVVFFAVGFETTSPAVAVTVKEAQKRNLKNFFVLSSQKCIPPAIRALLAQGKTKIDGFILPGHVSVIIGRDPYMFIAHEFGIPGVITGFEPLDILEGIYMLVQQKKGNQASIEIQYKRAVDETGNQRALDFVKQVFQVVTVRWRGLGLIPHSGLMLRDEFADMDAARVFKIAMEQRDDPPGCVCGEVLQGLKSPPDCELFARQCTPEHPVGPCMVSSEGTCAAYYQYGV